MPNHLLRRALPLAPAALSLAAFTVEVRQGAVDVLPAAEVARLARGATFAPRRLRDCRSSVGAEVGASRTTTCLLVGTTVPVRWTQVVRASPRAQQVIAEWDAPDEEGRRYAPPLDGGGRCALVLRGAPPSQQSRRMMVARAPGGVTLLRCERGAAGASSPAWQMGLRERPRRAPWALALGASLLAALGALAAFARRRDPWRLPWRSACLDAHGVHRLDDGRAVQHAWPGSPTEVLVLPGERAEVAYRSPESVAAERVETPPSLDALAAQEGRRRAQVAAALGALGCALAAWAHLIR